MNLIKTMIEWYSFPYVEIIAAQCNDNDSSTLSSFIRPTAAEKNYKKYKSETHLEENIYNNSNKEQK